MIRSMLTKEGDGGHLNQGFLHGRLAERIPRLQQVDESMVDSG